MGMASHEPPSGAALEIPDCAKGGDHSLLLASIVKEVLGDPSILSTSGLCRSCGLEVVVRRDEATGEITAALENIPASWLGM